MGNMQAALLTGQLILGQPDWIVYAVALAAFGAVVLCWAYLGTRWPFSWLPPALKILGLLVLASMLVEPLWSSTRPKAGANLFAILADNSQSMNTLDGGQQSRFELARRRLTDENASWTARLAETFDLRRYLFDSRLRQVGNFSELDGHGRATELGSALASLAERFEGRPLAGVLLFSDGVATDRVDAELLDGLPPVFPVSVGSQHPIKDIRIETIGVNQTAFEDAPVTVQVDAAVTGYRPTDVTAVLMAENGREIETMTLPWEGGELPLAFRFSLKPERPGVSFYRARVSAADEVSQFEENGRSQESTLANNERLIVVDRGQGPFRVLYLAGRPNWDFKFIRRAIQKDPQLQLAGLIRIAKREPKFDWRGRTGESSNPIYRGFDGKDEEETERYDQPVLARVGIEDETELRDGFPKTPEELYRYQALIIDDVEAEFFSTDQLELIDAFVSKRGGGLLMLGGQESLVEGKYARTPIEGLLPAYLERRRPEPGPGPFRVELTRDGWHQSWVRLRENESDERKRLLESPGFQVMNRLAGIKPGAVVLAEVEDSAGDKWPALVTQRYGHGRSAIWTIADTWRWQMQSDPTENDFAKAWRQIFRWLVSDVEGQVNMEVDSAAGKLDAPVKLRVTAKDKAFKPLDYAKVRLQVTPPKGKPINMEAEPVADSLGVFEAEFVSTIDGAYRAEAIVLDAANNEVGKARAGWAAEPAALEFRDLRPNHELLERIAEQTGGAMIQADNLDEFASSLPNLRVAITEQRLTPLWHRPSLFLIALTCFIAEWGLRRRRGLP